MKKWLSVLLCLALICFSGCSEKAEENPVSQNDSSAPVVVQEPADEEPEIVSSVETYLSEQWDGEFSVRPSDQKIDVVLSASGEIPDFLDAAQTIATKVSDLVADDQVVSRSTLMVKSGLDSSATIYLTFLDGNLSFRADEAEEYQAPNDEYITMDEFNQIQAGMSYQDVVNIIGSTGELLSSVDIGDAQYKTEMYSWEGKGSVGANASVMFQGGVVSSKAQFGLE